MVSKRYFKGFTLIELLIVITTISALAVVLFTNFYGLDKEKKLKDASLSIATMLRDAQQRSMGQEQGKSWGVGFELNSPNNPDRYFLFNTTQDPSGNITAWSEASSKFLPSPLKIVQPGVNTLVAFEQISGKAALSGCPDPAVSMKIEIADGDGNSRFITIFCNGRIEF